MTETIIRAGVMADVPELAALKRTIFLDTFVTNGFRIPYPADDLATFEAANFTPDRVAAEIADPDHATWVAERDGVLVGYAHVGPCKLPHPEATPDAGEVYQIYVSRAAQGTGLGGRLLDTALDHLAATRSGPIWLGVWSGNHRAQAVYAKRGFRNVGGYRYPVGTWEDDEFIFRRD